MEKIYTALGLMSGTSLDGIDASIISSDGEKFINIEKNEYYTYNDKFQDQLREFIKACNNKEYIEKNDKIYSDLQNELTIKHAEISNKIIKNYGEKIDFVGFHGHTIIHKPDKGYSIQMGDGQLLSQTLKQKVIYNFRKKDIENKGEGAPLASIYHYNLSKKLNLREPGIFLNIGGISNQATVWRNGDLSASDIGPGMCLIDKWIRLKTKKKYDQNGKIAKSEKINKKILEEVDQYIKEIEQMENDINLIKKILETSIDILNIPKINKDFIDISNLLQKNHLQTFFISEKNETISLGVYTHSKYRNYIPKFMNDLARYKYKKIQTDKISKINGYYISVLRFDK